MPTASVDVVSVATPPVKAADPIVVAPSLNVTDPTGTPPPGAAVTVALKVIGTPKSDGLLLDVTVVAVANEVGVTLIANVCAALVSTPPLVVPPLSQLHGDDRGARKERSEQRTNGGRTRSRRYS